MRSRTILTRAALLASALLALTTGSRAQDKAVKLTPTEAKAIAQEGYVFGLPPVYIALEADVLTLRPRIISACTLLALRSRACAADRNLATGGSCRRRSS
jgi:hypothetical protein